MWGPGGANGRQLLTTGPGIADRGQVQPAERKIAEFAGPEFSERDAERSRSLATDKIQNVECAPDLVFRRHLRSECHYPGAQSLAGLEFFMQ